MGVISGNLNLMKEIPSSINENQQIQTKIINLPRTSLCYAEFGQGEPLIIVPATISRIENWTSLIRFMGQRFRTFFFELPGHGESTPYKEEFSTALVAQTVEAFADAMGIRRFNLMGFSFGGILAMRSLNRLQDRIDRIILLSPVLSRQALQLNMPQRFVVKNFLRVMHRPGAQRKFVQLIRGRRTANIVGNLIRYFGSVEETITMEDVYRCINPSSVRVLTGQLSEMVGFEMSPREKPFAHPCFFAMSINDPIVNYGVTRSVVERFFASVESVEFQFPWHQPPERLTFELLNTNYRSLLDKIQ